MVGTKGEFQNFITGTCADALANADTAAAAATAREKSGADAQAAAPTGARNPFSYGFAIVQFGLLVRRPKLDHGLIVGVSADPAVPIHRRRALAAN